MKKFSTTSAEVRDAFKYLFPDELKALKTLAESLPENPVVINIGAGSGTSGLAFMEAREDMNLITVDIENMNSPFGSLHSERDLFARAGFPLATQTWEQRHGDSKSIGKYWTTPKADLIFIDGDHSYDGCTGDIKAWVPHLKEYGYLAIHDYNKDAVYEKLDPSMLNNVPHGRAWPGVDLAVNDFWKEDNKQVQPSFMEPEIVDTLIIFRKKGVKRGK